jgi:hypothetical protein
MPQPVYLLVIGKGFTEAGYRLTKQEMDDLWAKVQDVDNRAGAKWIIACASRWADEETLDWGVIEYPDMDAYQRKVAELEELQWWRYFEAETIFGHEAGSRPISALSDDSHSQFGPRFCRRAPAVAPTAIRDPPGRSTRECAYRKWRPTVRRRDLCVVPSANRGRCCCRDPW